jgi:hypothetical protein
LGEGFVGQLDAFGGLAAVGAVDGFFGRRAGVGVGIEVLLQQPGLEAIDGFTGACLALVEGGEVGLMLGVEHEVEGGPGVREPLLAEFGDALFAALLGVAHGDPPWWVWAA